MQSSQVLDFTQFLYTKGHHLNARVYNNQIAHELLSKFETNKLCPYCQSNTEVVLDLLYDPMNGTNFNYNHHTCHACSSCGWWYNVKHFGDRSDILEERRTISILRKFDVGDNLLPIQTLNIELRKHPDILYKVHHKKFEYLVADILKDFYRVEVEVVGRKDDGGIDLLYIQGDQNYAIQVKRRESAKKTESVALIREFLGAMKLKGINRGKIISNADKFSTSAINAAKLAVDKEIVTEFDLIDRKRFYDMFNFNQTKKYDYPWEAILENDYIDFINSEYHNLTQDSDWKIELKGFKNIIR